MSNWDQICQGDLNFMAAMANGVPIVEAYKKSVEKSRLDATESQAIRHLAMLIIKHPEIIKDNFSKECRKTMIDIKAWLRTNELLDSGDPDQVDKGLKHARAIHGLDEPTKIETNDVSPHLQKRPAFPSLAERLQLTEN